MYTVVGGGGCHGVVPQASRKSQMSVTSGGPVAGPCVDGASKRELAGVINWAGGRSGVCAAGRGSGGHAGVGGSWF